MVARSARLGGERLGGKISGMHACKVHLVQNLIVSVDDRVANGTRLHAIKRLLSVSGGGGGGGGGVVLFERLCARGERRRARCRCTEAAPAAVRKNDSRDQMVKT